MQGSGTEAKTFQGPKYQKEQVSKNTVNNLLIYPFCLVNDFLLILKYGYLGV